MRNTVLTFLFVFPMVQVLAQPLGNTNPLKETFNGKVKLVVSASYDCSGDSLNVTKLDAKNEERYLHHRKYDEKGRLSEIIYVRPDNKIKFRTVYTRDVRNNVVLEENFMSTGMKTKSIARIYNKKGLLLSEEIKNEKGKAVEKNIFAYQDTSRILEMFTRNDTICDQKVETKRDKKGKILEQVFYDRDCKTIVSKMLMQYDKNNNLTATKTITPEGALIARRAYVYDKQNRLLSRTDYDASKTILRHLEYVYDDKGKLRQETEAGKNGELLSKMLCSYDSTGRLEWDHKFSSTRDMDVISYYKYDAYNNVVQRRQKRSNMEMQTDSIVYEYDKQGNWIKRIIYRASRPTQIDERTITYYE